MRELCVLYLAQGVGYMNVHSLQNPLGCISRSCAFHACTFQLNKTKISIQMTEPIK